MISVIKASFHFVEMKKKNSIEQKSFAQIDNFNNEFLVSKNILAFVESLSKLRILEFRSELEDWKEKRRKK